MWNIEGARFENRSEFTALFENRISTHASKLGHLLYSGNGENEQRRASVTAGTAYPLISSLLVRNILRGNTMKNLIASSLGAVAMATSFTAMAADLPSRVAAPAPVLAAVPVAFSWSGFYAGLNAGYGWNYSRWSPAAPPVFAAFRADADGFVGGGHVGFNWQMGQFVAGVEGMLDYSDMSGSAQCSTFPGTVCRTRQDWLGDINLKLGFAVDRALIYGTGGIAFTNFKLTQPVGAPPADFGSHSRTGWTIGAGVDYAFTNNWVAGLQYKYYDFGSFNGSAAGTNVRFRETDHVLLAKISYMFGGPSTSGVVARY